MTTSAKMGGQPRAKASTKNYHSSLRDLGSPRWIDAVAVLIVVLLLAAAAIHAQAQTAPQGGTAAAEPPDTQAPKADVAMNAAARTAARPVATPPAAPDPAKPKDDLPPFHPLTDF